MSRGPREQAAELKLLTWVGLGNHGGGVEVAGPPLVLEILPVAVERVGSVVSHRVGEEARPPVLYHAAVGAALPAGPVERRLQDLVRRLLVRHAPLLLGLHLCHKRNPEERILSEGEAKLVGCN